MANEVVKINSQIKNTQIHQSIQPSHYPPYLPNALVPHPRTRYALRHDRTPRCTRPDLTRRSASRIRGGSESVRVLSILDLFDADFAVDELVDVGYDDWALDVHEGEGGYRIAIDVMVRIGVDRTSLVQ